MKKSVANYIKGRIKSFEYAFNGLRILFKGERNAQIQLMVAIIALLLGIFLRISAMEWIVLCMLIGLVLAMEALNTAIEYLADFACNKKVETYIKKTKDLSAAAVLVMAITALIGGLIIFLPKLLNLFF